MLLLVSRLVRLQMRWISGRSVGWGMLAVAVAASSRSACAQARSGQAGRSTPVTAVSAPAPVTAVSAPATRMVATRVVVRGADIVGSARRFLGSPYRLGGTTPRAFDCSGFVRYVFALHGVALPRTAHEQAAVGEAPAPGDSLQQGDLLFFWGGHGAQHIAIYVGGDSIIHASSSGHAVRVDRLTGGARAHRTWFNQRLIAVRRLLPANGLTYVSSSAPAFSFIAGPNPQW
jgi:cell wall-associated NlpC family hydrolase